MMRILITAGPTREPIDAVRYISNRSSGKMGLALARAGAAAGHQVTLLLGPIDGDSGCGAGVNVERFESSADLERLLRSRWPSHDVLVMAAAVADYRPSRVAPGKTPRQQERLALSLEPTPDLVAMMAAGKQPGQRVVAFALEEEKDLERRAAAKLQAKNVDAIVANSLETMGSDEISPVWLTADGGREVLGKLSKEKFAEWLIGRVTVM